MEVFFNELSIHPQCTDKETAKGRIMNILHLMKALKEHNINILRTYPNFYIEDLGGGYSVNSFLTDQDVKRDLKTLLLTIVKNPYIPEADSYEAEVFINNRFETNDHAGRAVSTEGLAVSYIYNVPSVSLDSHGFWKKDALSLNVYDTTQNVSNDAIVINLSHPGSIESNEFRSWLQAITQINLNSYENITALFPTSEYLFDKRAIDDIISWYYDDARFLIRIIELIKDIKSNPYTGGKGHTEALSGDKQSKRIIKKDRIVYRYTAEMIHIYQCRGHYDDK